MRWLPVLSVLGLVSFLGHPSLAQARQQSTSSETGDVTPASDATTLATVVVKGAVPGPGVWRIVHGENVLYLLATVSPLPGEMQWATTEVDDILAHADEVIAPGGAEPRIGAGDVLKMATLARSAAAATHNPDGQVLEQRLPAPVFEQWRALKAKYLGDDRSVDKSRPMFASQSLYYGAIESSGLTRADIVWKRVAELAAARGVPVRETKFKFPLAIDRAAYKAGIRALSESTVDETTCFSATLASLESDLERMKQGANAWATGNLERLQTLRQGDLRPACKEAYDRVMGFQRRPELEVQAKAAWMMAANAALGRNRTTLAVLPMVDLVGPEGVLAQMRSRGYIVQAPDEDVDTDPGSD